MSFHPLTGLGSLLAHPSFAAAGPLVFGAMDEFIFVFSLYRGHG